MRRHLNTLYVTTDGAWLRKEGENAVMEVAGKEQARAPLHMIGSLVCIGRVLVSPKLMGHCAAQGISICFLDRNGRFLARVEGPVSGNVLLRCEQHRLTDGDACAEVVRSTLIGKVHNQRTVIRRALRDHGEGLAEASATALRSTEAVLTRVLRRLSAEVDVDVMRGIEGEAAAAYFAVFDALIRKTGEPRFRFECRSRRPPLDEVNALLSFLYTLLLHDCRSALETVGLDPAVGFLHRLRPGRPSLALDLMEEFRPMLADRLALSLINRRQLMLTDFETLPSGAVSLKHEPRKSVIKAYQERKQMEIRHHFLEELTTVGMLPQLQAQLLARFLRGDLDGYPPFLWK